MWLTFGIRVDGPFLHLLFSPCYRVSNLRESLWLTIDGSFYYFDNIFPFVNLPQWLSSALFFFFAFLVSSQNIAYFSNHFGFFSLLLKSNLNATEGKTIKKFPSSFFFFFKTKTFQIPIFSQPQTPTQNKTLPQYCTCFWVAQGCHKISSTFCEFLIKDLESGKMWVSDSMLSTTTRWRKSATKKLLKKCTVAAMDEFCTNFSNVNNTFG